MLDPKLAVLGLSQLIFNKRAAQDSLGLALSNAVQVYLHVFPALVFEMVGLAVKERV
jgi:hypothetical protein